MAIFPKLRQERTRNGQDPPGSRGPSWWPPSTLWLFLAALAQRLGYSLLHRAYDFSGPFSASFPHHWNFGFEFGSVARAIAHGHGFSSPFDVLAGPTGPTALVPPVYPLLAAPVFRWLGDFSHATAFVLVTLNDVFSALTVIPVFLFAQRSFGRRVALWSGGIWALVPYFDRWHRWIWNTSLATLLLSWLFLMGLQSEEDRPCRWWCGCGVLWGIAALTEPAVLSLLPFAVLWAARRPRRGLALERPGGSPSSTPPLNSTPAFPAVALMLACALLAAAPWLIRNRLVFGQWLFLRSGLGLELSLSNYQGSTLAREAPGLGMAAWITRHPSFNPAELQQYEELGEVAYMRLKRQEALSFIQHHPVEFAGLTARRLLIFWDGAASSYDGHDLHWRYRAYVPLSVLSLLGLACALARRRTGAFLYAAVLLFFPVIYYLTYPATRYRHTIEPVLLVLAVYALGNAAQLAVAGRSAALPGRVRAHAG
jgi:hypothetical protein